MSKEKLISNYSNAFLELIKDEDTIQFKQDLISFSSILRNAKIQKIINSNISNSEKVLFVISFLKNKKNVDKLFTNFIKLLVQENRLILLLPIIEYILKQFNIKNRTFDIIYDSKFDIKKDDVSKLNTLFSKKLDSRLEHTTNKSNLEGLKIFVDDINVSISVSMNDLKNRLKKHILKNF